MAVSASFATCIGTNQMPFAKALVSKRQAARVEPPAVNAISITG